MKMTGILKYMFWWFILLKDRHGDFSTIFGREIGQELHNHEQQVPNEFKLYNWPGGKLEKKKSRIP